MIRARSSKDEWRRVFSQQRSSGLSIAAFCRREDIAPATFFFWRRRLRDESQFSRRRGRTRFAEVKLLSAGAPSQVAWAAGDAGSNGIELRLEGDRRIVVRPGFDRRTLLDLVEALEGGASQGREGIVR